MWASKDMPLPENVMQFLRAQQQLLQEYLIALCGQYNLAVVNAPSEMDMKNGRIHVESYVLACLFGVDLEPIECHPIIALMRDFVQIEEESCVGFTEILVARNQAYQYVSGKIPCLPSFDTVQYWLSDFMRAEKVLQSLCDCIQVAFFYPDSQDLAAVIAPLQEKLMDYYHSFSADCVSIPRLSTDFESIVSNFSRVYSVFSEGERFQLMSNYFALAQHAKTDELLQRLSRFFAAPRFFDISDSVLELWLKNQPQTRVIYTAAYNLSQHLINSPSMAYEPPSHMIGPLTQGRLGMLVKVWQTIVPEHKQRFVSLGHIAH